MTNPINGGSRPVNSSGTETARTAKNRGTDQATGSRPEGTPANKPAESASTSERLQAVRQGIDQTPEVDQDRVDAIKQSIAEGRYVVNPDKIAQKFAELEGLLNQ